MRQNLPIAQALQQQHYTCRRFEIQDYSLWLWHFIVCMTFWIWRQGVYIKHWYLSIKFTGSHSRRQ